MTNLSDATLSKLQAQIGSADWNRWNLQRWQYYDYVTYNTAGGLSSLSLMSQPLGSVDPVSNAAKTLEDTNVLKSGCFGRLFFVITQVRLDLRFAPKYRQPSTISEATRVATGTLMNTNFGVWYQLANNGVLTGVIGTKPYVGIEQPFRLAPPGFGLNLRKHSGNINAAVTGESTYAQLGSNPDDVYTLSPEQMIEPDQTFTWTLGWPNATSPALITTGSSQYPVLKVGLILDGYRAQPVS